MMDHSAGRCHAILGDKYMGEIGGYFELERNYLPMPHEGAIALNSGGNCLAYLIRARKIRKIWLPYMLCDSIFG